MSVLWPYFPLDGLIEALEFKTDVMRARAAEQRVRLTDVPRRVFSANYRFTPLAYERARSLMRASAPGPFWLPEAAEYTRMTVVNGQTILLLDTTSKQYSEGGTVAIVEEGGGDGEVCLIDQVDDDGLVLVSGPSRTYTNAVVAPAFQAFAPNGMTGQTDVHRSPFAGVEWRLHSGPNWADSFVAADTYRGDPLMSQCAQVGAGAFDESIVRDVEIVDSGIGVPFYDDVLTEAQQLLAMAWMPTADELMDLRRWFYYLHGAQRAFWLPCWNRGVQLTGDVTGGAGTIEIASIGFEGAYGAGDLFFRMADGTVHTLQVTGASDNGITETLTLDGVAPAIAVEQVKVGCLMFRVRLAADRIEIAHRVGAGTRIQVPCKEVPL